MPQKTRREKQIAELRRKLAMQTQNAPAGDASYSLSRHETTLKKEIIKEAPYKLTTPLVEKNLSSGNFVESLAVNTKYVAADLRKTFLLTILVIVFEMMLFYVWEIR